MWHCSSCGVAEEIFLISAILHENRLRNSLQGSRWSSAKGLLIARCELDGTEMQKSTHDTVPWRLREGRPPLNGALEHQQMHALGEAYGFMPDQMLDLSRRIDIGLSRELHITSPELNDVRQRRGQVELKTVLKRLSSASKTLADAKTILEAVRVRNLYTHVGMPNPELEHREILDEAEKGIKEALSFYAIAARDDLAFYTAHPDKRQVYDIRREIVCTGIFNVWEDAGRALSFTTDPITSKRGGPLLDFVNAVVEYITDPPTRLSGEAIKTEIKRYKRGR